MPRGRPDANIEFIRLLRELTDFKTDGEFARACRKKQSNISNYLRGRKVPGKRVLRSCLDNLRAGRGPQPIMEVDSVPENLRKLPAKPGVYVIYDSAGRILYIGRATSFRTTVPQTMGRTIPSPLRLGPTLEKSNPKIRDLASRLSLYEVTNERLRHNLEALLLRVTVNHTHNTNIGTFR